MEKTKVQKGKEDDREHHNGTWDDVVTLYKWKGLLKIKEGCWCYFLQAWK